MHPSAAGGGAIERRHGQRTKLRLRAAARIETLESRAYLSISFGTPIDNGGVEGAQGIAVADFNGDGKKDVVVVGTATSGGANSAVIAIYPGNGNGTFTSHSLVNDPGSRSGYDVIAADFNGDNKIDLAVSNPMEGTVSLFLGNGDGTFQAPHNTVYGNTIPTGTAGVANLAIGDFNKDQKPDLVVTDPFDHHIDALLGNGDGTFSDTSYNNGGAANFSPTLIVAADFSGDGNPDIAFTDGTSSNVFVALGDGHGAFATATANALLGAANDLTVADFNMDGKPDIMAAAPLAPGSVAAELVNTGGGTFAGVRSFGTEVPNGQAISGADYTGDGKPDLVMMASDGTLISGIGNGDGSFQVPVSTPPTAATSVHRIVAADFDGDGSLDIAFTATNSTLASGGGFTVLPTGTAGVNNVSTTLSTSLVGKLPASAITGQKLKIRQTITFTNIGTTPLVGTATAAFYLSPTNTVTSSSIPLPGTISAKLNLKPGKHQRVSITVSTLPSTASGDYYLVLRTADLSGATAIAASATKMSVAPPTVDVSGAFAKVPTTVSVGQKSTVTVLITNHSNIPVSGSLDIVIKSSTDATLDSGDVTLATTTKKLNLKVGKSIRVTLKNLLAPTNPGSYFFIGQVDPANTANDVNLANNIFTSPVTVS
jgi:hypothetical protein